MINCHYSDQFRSDSVVKLRYSVQNSMLMCVLYNPENKTLTITNESVPKASIISHFPNDFRGSDISVDRCVRINDSLVEFESGNFSALLMIPVLRSHLYSSALTLNKFRIRRNAVAADLRVLEAQMRDAQAPCLVFSLSAAVSLSRTLLS